MILGAAGSLPVATNNYRWRMAGFALWVASDICWIAFGFVVHSWPLVAINAIYTLASSLGLWNSWKALRVSQDFLRCYWN
jgi:hypothetical protein